jgi:hypothetical protein
VINRVLTAWTTRPSRISAGWSRTVDQPYDLEPPLVLTGRVLVARQMHNLCGESFASEPHDLGPYDDSEPQPGDLKISTRLDAKGKLAFQDDRTECFISGVLSTSIYDGTSWQRFDLRSITPHTSYKNPTLLESIVASVRMAAELNAGMACVRTGARDGDSSTGEKTVAVSSQRQPT